MTNDNDKLDKVEKALDKIRDSFLFPRPELNSTLEKNTRNLLDVSYSLLYSAKEQQSEIEKLKEDLARNSISDEDQVVIWVDNKYYLIMKLLYNNVSFALSKPHCNCVGCYSYGDAKFVLDGSDYHSLHLLEDHNVELIPIKDFNKKLETSYSFVGLDFHEE
jgi:hypothetical protein